MVIREKRKSRRRQRFISQKRNLYTSQGRLIERIKDLESQLYNERKLHNG